MTNLPEKLKELDSLILKVVQMPKMPLIMVMIWKLTEEKLRLTSQIKEKKDPKETLEVKEEETIEEMIEEMTEEEKENLTQNQKLFSLVIFPSKLMKNLLEISLVDVEILKMSELQIVTMEKVKDSAMLNSNPFKLLVRL